MEYIEPSRSPNETDFEFELRQIIVAGQMHSTQCNALGGFQTALEAARKPYSSTLHLIDSYQKEIDYVKSQVEASYQQLRNLQKTFSEKYDPNNSQIQREIKEQLTQRV